MKTEKCANACPSHFVEYFLLLLLFVNNSTSVFGWSMGRPVELYDVFFSLLRRISLKICGPFIWVGDGSETETKRSGMKRTEKKND